MPLTPKQRQARRLWKMRALGLGYESAVDADATAYIAAMDVEPDATRQSLINDLVVDLKASGIWSKLTWLSLFAAHDSQAGLLNAVNPAQEATPGISAAFTTDRGFLGDGTGTGIVNTGIAANVIWPTNTSCSLFVIMQAQGTVLTDVAGYRSLRGQLQHGASSPPVIRLFSTVAANATTNSANGQFVAATRTGTSIAVTVEASQEGSATEAVNTLGNTNQLRFLGSDNLYSNGRIAVGGAGSYLTLAERQALRTALRTYLTAVGAI